MNPEQTFPCCICGEEISISTTQILIPLGDGKYESCCCRHEGSEALHENIKTHKIERKTEF